MAHERFSWRDLVLFGNRMSDVTQTREAEHLDKSTFAIAFYRDMQDDEEKRGVIISCNTKKFFTDRWNFITPTRRRSTCPSTKTTGHLLSELGVIPTKEFCTDRWNSIMAGEIQGQTRQHSIAVSDFIVFCEPHLVHTGPSLLYKQIHFFCL